ncbi:DegV family protein [Clostridium thermobutyricum]|uniref:DegV family protein n=1 Tax=Clostridium thermobutyricum TaxID=29372 RepID=UPI0029422027|nr:DegV family protein [Clostridium thermobutyricum]
MKKIGVLTDSSCDLTLETLKENNIEMLPIRIIYKEREFLDKITITSEEMYESLSTEIPTTSLPDLKTTDKILDKFIDEGYTDLIIVCVSNKLSGTLNSIRLIAEEKSGINFHFLDTKTLGYPQGAIVLEVAKLVEQGKTAEEIVQAFESIRNRTHGFITFNTLEYLKRGGRIGKISGTIGEILHIKPIVSSDDDGELYTYTKTRGRKKAISKMKNILFEYLETSKCRVWVLSGAADEEAKEFFENVKGHENIIDISLEQIGAAMGIHTGPGALGLCILEENV